MFSAFHMGPAASGRRLCVIERVLFRFKITCQKIVPASRKYIDYNLKAKLSCKEPNFMARDLLPLNNNLSISHSLPRWLAEPYKISKTSLIHERTIIFIKFYHTSVPNI